MQIIAQTPNSTQLVRLDDGRIALVFTPEPNHTTANGNPAFTAGSGFNGFVSAKPRNGDTDYAVKAMIVLTSRRAKLQVKADKLAAKLDTLLAEIAPSA